MLLEEPSDPAAAPDDRTSPVAVLALHGPGGIGGTTLLRRFAVDAERRGRHVVEVDAERTEPTERAFAAAADAAGTGRLVLLVDAADHLGSLEDWFRDRFLTRLAPGSLVVLAGRRPPSLRWRTDPAWYDTLRVVRLEGLSPAGSARLLRDATTGRTADRAARLAFAGGHPLALRLVGSDRGDGPPGEWQPSPHVVEDLLDRVVGPVPSPVHLRAPEICTHVTEVPEDLLRALLPDHAHEMFDWMRRQPYATSHRNGLRLLGARDRLRRRGRLLGAGLMREELGAEGDEPLDFRLHRRPAGFRVYRSVRSGDVGGFPRSVAGRGLRPGRRVQLVPFLLVRRRSADRPAALAATSSRTAPCPARTP
ncbi:hypothetical protein ACH47C_16730 [Streptomyces rishiriensis]|uniref:P-loop NTPase n=1 Tax=Streptomyces rishiriensis TaxID=68264 RepID=UPI0034086FBA